MKIIQPSVKLLHATPQNLIPHVARASYQSYAKQSEDTDAQLLAHLRKNEESPLEFAWAVLDITCSFAAHVHLLRHRFFSQSWRSQRYDETMQFVLPAGLSEAHTEVFAGDYASTETEFLLLRQDGLKKQDARYLTPQGVAVQGFMAGNARAWVSFLKLRTSKKAMPETRLIAQLIEAELKQVWPEVIL